MVSSNFKHGNHQILGSNSIVVYKLIKSEKVEIILEGGWTCVVGPVLSLGLATCRHIFLISKDHPNGRIGLVWLIEIIK